MFWTESAESIVDTENVFCSLASRHPSSTSTSEADQKKVRTKLKKFLLKRPTLQSVKDRGYIRGRPPLSLVHFLLLLLNIWDENWF